MLCLIYGFLSKLRKEMFYILKKIFFMFKFNAIKVEKSISRSSRGKKVIGHLKINIEIIISNINLNNVDSFFRIINYHLKIDSQRVAKKSKIPKHFL